MENKPNLIFVATRVPHPPATGHSLRTLNILCGLAEHYTVHFFGFHNKDSTPSERLLADAAVKRICATAHLELVGCERSKARLLMDLATSLLTFQPFTAAKYRSPTMHRAIAATLATHHVVVVHADSLQSGQYLIGLTQPKLLTNHNVEYQRLSRHANLQRSGPYRFALKVQAHLTKYYERKILAAVGNCVAVSESDRIALSQLSPHTRVFVVPNGADTSQPSLAPAASSGVTALWVGGMNDPFNREGVLHFARRILPLIKARMPGFRWYVVGRDPPAELCALADDPDSGVQLAGFVTELRDAYERSTIVVVPLLSGGGTKLKVLEAMAMGRAVVTTPVGAEGIDARDSVEIEIASTDEEFAVRACGLLNDPVRRNYIAAAARALVVQLHAWDVVNRHMLDAVESVININPQRQLTTPCVG